MAKKNIKNIKKDFPIFKNVKVHGKAFIYLDSGATSQKPKMVVEAETNWYKKHNSNIHRGAYQLAEEATELFESTRSKVASFIKSKSHENIVFTKGTTDGINLVAQSWVKHNLKRGDTILISEMEHHSNIVPWQLLAKEKGFKLKFWPVTSDGKLDMTNMNSLFREVKFLSLIHVSNVLGTINPVEEIIKKAHRKNIKVLIDAAQSVPHRPIDVSKMDPDFLVFSSHKMLGPTGIGALYIKPARHKEVRPYQSGGDMILEVKQQGSTFKPVPGIFEAGTPALAQVFAFGKAIDYLNSVGMQNVLRHEKSLVQYAYQKLSAIPEVTIYGPKPANRSGLVSFTVKGIHAHDLATFLDKEGVAIRAGHHCAMPLHHKLKIDATARASFYIYNTKQDVDKLAKALQLILKQWQSSINK
jgi:cysteine desulfurase/selenocysteine lyase